MTPVLRGRPLLAFLALGVLYLLAACTTAPSQLTAHEVRQLEGKSVGLHMEPSTHMTLAADARSVSTALPDDPTLSSRSAEHNSVRLQRQDHVADPVTIVGFALLEELLSDHHMHGAPEATADVVLSVNVTGWGALHLLPLTTRYGGTIKADARIIDKATKKTLRDASCFIRPHRRPDSPTLEELLRRSGEVLRAEVDAATQACIAALTHSLLGA